MKVLKQAAKKILFTFFIILIFVYSADGFAIAFYEMNGNLNDIQGKIAQNYNIGTENIASVTGLAETEEEKLKIEVFAKSGDKEIKDNDDVYVGQGITYKVNVTNVSGQKLENVKLHAMAENAILYNYVQKQDIDPWTNENQIYTYYQEDKECKEFITKEITLEADSSYTFSYDVTVEKQTETNITTGNIKITVNDEEIAGANVFKNPIKDANVKVVMKTAGAIEVNGKETKNYVGENYSTLISVINLTDDIQKDVNVDIYIPKQLEHYNISKEDMIDVDLGLSPDENNVLHVQIPELQPKEEITYVHDFKIVTADDTKVNEEFDLFSSIKQGDNNVLSNTLHGKTEQTKVNMDVTYSSDKQEQGLNDGDLIVFEGNIKGNSAIDKEIDISVQIPDGIEIQKVYINEDDKNEELNIQDIAFGKIEKRVKLTKNGQIKVVIEGKVDLSIIDEEELESQFTVVSGTETINKSVKIMINQVEDDEGMNDLLGDDGEDDENNTQSPEKPGNSGSSGNVDENNNQKNERNKIFDLSLDKTVTEITIRDNGKDKTTTFKDSKLAKAEIDVKRLLKTTAFLKYKIKVTNEGEIAGTADEIVDYLPKDVTFDKSLNPDWNKGTDGNIYTNCLAKQVINPGESKEITLILTKKMTEDNVGTTINTAEISKASNMQNVIDRDSTPKNKNASEDDFSKADIIICIKTGANNAFINIGGLLIIILGLSLYLIKKGRE